MLAVQVMEMALGMLAMVISVDPAKPSRAPFEVQLRRSFRKAIHTFQRASASELRKQLDDERVSSDLLDEIQTAIKWRNILAHRYLRERLDRSSARMFRTGTLAELESLTASFEGTSRQLQSLSDEIRADLSQGSPDTPPDVGAG